MKKKLLKHLPISLNGQRIKLLQLKTLFLEGTFTPPYTILKQNLDCYFKSKNNFIRYYSNYHLLN